MGKFGGLLTKHFECLFSVASGAGYGVYSVLRWVCRGNVANVFRDVVRRVARCFYSDLLVCNDRGSFLKGVLRWLFLLLRGDELGADGHFVRRYHCVGHFGFRFGFAHSCFLGVGRLTNRIWWSLNVLPSCFRVFIRFLVLSVRFLGNFR